MNKPNTYKHISGYRPKLHVLMAFYGNSIKMNPRAWLHGMKFTVGELEAFPEIASALGYKLKLQSQPYVINFELIQAA